MYLDLDKLNSFHIIYLKKDRFKKKSYLNCIEIIFFYVDFDISKF